MKRTNKETLERRFKRFRERVSNHAMRHYALTDELDKIKELAEKHGIDIDNFDHLQDLDIGDFMC